MRTDKMTLRLVLSLFSICAISATARAQTLAAPHSLMCTPGELIFSEDFAPETVSERWGSRPILHFVTGLCYVRM